ncbi:hypothetical protein G6F56_007807 [Rhizopus delemar]|nr:hypothetical protein G6F56_007807 [Rhizopus delemar]
MLHKDPTNQNSENSNNGSNQQQEDSSREQKRTSSAAIWQTFRAYSKNTRNETVTAFEDKDGKAISRQRRNERLWIQSSEKNSAAFDIQSVNLAVDVFLESLSSQYPEAIGGVDTQQGAVRGTVVAFDSQEARDKACSIGIQVKSMTIIGTPTLSSDSSVFRISLDKLPILRPSDLSPLLQEVFKQYGKVLHVGLYLDPKTKLFFGKGYVMLDTANESTHAYQKLTHEISLGEQRIILATWRGMEQHCFYCHKPGHTKNDCHRLQRQRVKNCYACGSSDHLVRDCPKAGTSEIGEKRARPSPATPLKIVLENKSKKSVVPRSNSVLKNNDKLEYSAASKYANKDHVVANNGVSTKVSHEDNSSTITEDNISDEDEDKDYIPPSASEMSSDESGADGETEDMMIDNNEIQDLRNDIINAEGPMFQSQERMATAQLSVDDEGTNNTNL